MSPLRRGAALLVALAVLTVASVLPASADSHDAVGTSVFTVEGRAGIGEYGKATWSFAGDDLLIDQVSSASDAMTVTGRRGGVPVIFAVTPREGSPRFVPGVQSSSRDGLMISLFSGADCAAGGGSIDLLSVSRSDDGRINSIAFDYQVLCAAGPIVEGSVRWHSNEPYRYTSPSFPEQLWAGRREAVRATAVLTNEGTVPQTYGSTTFETTGLGAELLTPTVDEDGCDGTTLLPGESCFLEVSVVSPDGEQGARGHLATVDGSPRGVVYTPVLVLGGGPDAEGTFSPVDPVRVLDTRRGIGAPVGPLGAGRTLTFDPASTGDIPETGVSAVMLNLTGTAPTATTFVRVWPAGAPMPATSSLNLYAGQTRPNQVVVPVGAGGDVSLYNSTGSTHLVVDVQGFYSTADGVLGGGYHPMTPERIFDTRTTHLPALGPDEAAWVALPPGSVDPDTVTTVDVNLTVTRPTDGGYLTAWSGSGPLPRASNINFSPGQTIANHAVVPVSYDPEFDEYGFVVYNRSGDTHVVVDLQGWYDDGTDPTGLAFTATAPTRVADSRRSGGPVKAGGALVVPGSALPDGAAHVVNLTAVNADGAGYLTVWDGVGTPPAASSLNYLRSEVVPNLATPGVGPDGQIGVAVRISDVHVVVDHLGYFW